MHVDARVLRCRRGQHAIAVAAAAFDDADAVDQLGARGKWSRMPTPVPIANCGGVFVGADRVVVRAFDDRGWSGCESRRRSARNPRCGRQPVEPRSHQLVRLRRP